MLKVRALFIKMINELLKTRNIKYYTKINKSDDLKKSFYIISKTIK